MASKGSMKNGVIIGAGAQISNYFPPEFERINARKWFKSSMPLKSQEYDIAVIAFGENRTYLQDLTLDGFREINVKLTVQAVQRFTGIAKRIVVFGTAELWSGINGPISMNNSYNYRPSNYIISKQEMVDQVRNMNQPNVFIIHPFNFNTVHRCGEFLFGKVYKSILNREHIEIADTYFKRDLTTASEVARAALYSLHNESIVGSGRQISINELIRQLYKCANLNYDSYVSEDLSLISPRRNHCYYSEFGVGGDPVEWMLADLSHALSMRSLPR